MINLTTSFEYTKLILLKSENLFTCIECYVLFFIHIIYAQNRPDLSYGPITSGIRKHIYGKLFI